MAKQTVDQLHTEIGVNGNNHRIIASRDGASTDMHYVVGGASAPGRARWCTVTHSGSVSAQVTEITDTLIDGY